MMIKGAQSVYRTLNILKLIVQQCEKKISLKEISEELEIPASTVHRLLSVLKECGFVSFDAAGKKYYIGEECIINTNFNRDNFIKTKYSGLAKHIAEQFGYTTSLYSRKGYDCVCIDRIEGTHSIQVFASRIGDRRPLGLGCCTLAILAFLDDDEIEDIISHNESQLRKQVVSSLDDIRIFIEISKSLGYGYAYDLSVKDAVGISFPLYIDGEIVGSLALDSLKGKEWDEQLDIMVDYIKANIT